MVLLEVWEIKLGGLLIFLLGSAAASMIPIMGQMRALNYIGKSLSKVGNVSKIGRGINTLGRTITNNKVQATIGTLYGAHLDIMQEIV